MDFGAYVQIDDLEYLMKENGIEVPRLRGLRLMKDEEPLTRNEISEIAKEDGLYRCESLCECGFDINAFCYEWSQRTDAIKEYYLEFPAREDGTIDHTSPIAVRWDRIHGKKRKAFKYVIRKAKQKTFKQFEVWNKYCGRDDVLYIHARIGGNNWNYYGGEELAKQPWFLEKVDDHFDNTYCDIYAKIEDRMES